MVDELEGISDELMLAVFLCLKLSYASFALLMYISISRSASVRALSESNCPLFGHLRGRQFCRRHNPQNQRSLAHLSSRLYQNLYFL
jgi:hypothetical protein